MSDIYEITTQLARLWPALAAALRRDTAGGDPVCFASAQTTAAVPYNPDVLAAIVTLETEIPAAYGRACDLIAERHEPRGLDACLLALPRLASRMDATGRLREAAVLARQAASWLRITKRALGLRKPDIPLVGYACPYTADEPEKHLETDMLFMAGAEGCLRQTPAGLVVEWVVAERIYCASEDCAASWTSRYEWWLLGKMLGVPSLAAAS